MLTISGNSIRLCDRLPRREFLTIGSLAGCGLTLPQLLRTEAPAGVRASHKSIILIYLTGGPPHQNMPDLKPDAPAEIRGEFQPIATNVSGIQISELTNRSANSLEPEQVGLASCPIELRGWRLHPSGVSWLSRSWSCNS